MKRVVLFLIVAAVAMFLLVLKTPLRTSVLLRGIVDGNPSAPPAADSKPQPAAKAVQARASGLHRAASATNVSRQAKAPEPDARNTRVPIPSVAPAAFQKPLTGLATVSMDRLPVFSINSSTGDVMRFLDSGTTVEIELEVVSASGRWTLVRLANQNLSGFVRSEALARFQSAEIGGR